MVPGEHVPVRPTWGCVACGDPWPCLHARAAMVSEMRTTEMVIYCWGYLDEAAADLPEMTALEGFDRFINWHRP